MKLSHSTAVISESGTGPATVRRLEVKTQDFVVENYSSIRKTMGGAGRCIQTQDIFCGGHYWPLLFAPVGTTDEGFATVCFVPTTNATRNVSLMIDIHLIDQSGNGRRVGFSDRHVVLVHPSDDLAAGCERGRLIERSILHSSFLENDCLEFRVCVGVFRYHEADHSLPSSSFPYIPSDGSGPSEKMQLGDEEFVLSEEMQLGDEFVFIQVADQTFGVAKCALARRCPKLLSYDAHGHLQDIVISDVIQPRIFQVVLEYINAARIFKTDEKAILDSDPLDLESFAAKLLAASTMLKLKPLKRMCEKLISNKICRESVASLLHLAHLCNASHLKSECLKFESQDQLVMMKCDEFQLLEENCPLLFLEMAEKEEGEEGLTTLKKEVLNMYKKIQCEVGLKIARILRMARKGSDGSSLESIWTPHLPLLPLNEPLLQL